MAFVLRFRFSVLRFPVVLFLSLWLSSTVFADEIADLLKGPDRRAAWNAVVEKGPALLTRLLEAMDGADTPTANWLRTAFDRIVERERTAGRNSFDTDVLLSFVREPKHAGRARRLALELVEVLQPGTTARLVPGWLGDPEFNFEAVEALVKQADAGKPVNGDLTPKIETYRKAFTATRDLNQAKAIATRLQNHNVAVSVADHFGFLRDWDVIGPFDGDDMKGFKTVFPPETNISVKEAEGKGGAKVAWKPLHVKEPPPATPGHVALVNLRDAFGDVFDAVAYARVLFNVDKAGDYELRGAADDNLSVWVNGDKAFSYEEYRNGVRFDRHRFKVKLKAGANAILVKVCQAPLDPTSPEPNFEFLLRLVDSTGRGVPVKVVAPKPSGGPK